MLVKTRPLPLARRLAVLGLAAIVLTIATLVLAASLLGRFLTWGAPRVWPYVLRLAGVVGDLRSTAA